MDHVPVSYTHLFVWKKAVTKNQAKLLIKLADFVAECEQLYDIKIAVSYTHLGAVALRN